MDKAEHRCACNCQVLILEHDPALRNIMEISLKETGVKVEAVSQCATALQILQHAPPDVFVMDFDVTDGDSSHLIHTYREHSGREAGAVIVSTTNRLADTWRQKHCPDAVIYKPFDIRYLIRLILPRLQPNQFQAANT